MNLMENPENRVRSIRLKTIFKFEVKFYKILFKISAITKIYLNVPELLIYGFGFKTPTLICTDYRSGELLINQNLSGQAVSETFLLFANSSQVGIPIALSKTPHNSKYRDKCQLLYSPSDCEYVWNTNLSQNRGLIIQRFIKSPYKRVFKSEYLANSKVKTFLYRKKIEKNLSQSILLKKNLKRQKFLITREENCSKSPVAAQAIESKMMYLVNLIEKYFIKEYYIRISEFKCNWIEDINGKFLLINVKEYKILSNMHPNKTLETSESTPNRSILPTISFVKKIQETQEKKGANSVIKVFSRSSISDYLCNFIK